MLKTAFFITLFSVALIVYNQYRLIEFHNENKKEFKLLKNKIEQCLKNGKKSCARKNITVLEKYITSPSDIANYNNLRKKI